MIELRVVIGLLLISSLGYGKVEKAPTKAAQEEAEQLFKSDLGFEIKIPKCLHVESANSDDLEKDIKKVDIGITKLGSKPCFVDQKNVELAVSQLYVLKNHETSELWVAKEEQSAKRNKLLGGRNYLLTKKNILPNVQYLQISEHNGQFLRFEAYAICGKKVFSLGFRRDLKDLRNVIKAIENGDPSLPEVEKKMIESFRCAEDK